MCECNKLPPNRMELFIKKIAQIVRQANLHPILEYPKANRPAGFISALNDNMTACATIEFDFSGKQCEVIIWDDLAEEVFDRHQIFLRGTSHDGNTFRHVFEALARLWAIDVPTGATPTNGQKKEVRIER